MKRPKKKLWGRNKPRKREKPKKPPKKRIKKKRMTKSMMPARLIIVHPAADSWVNQQKNAKNADINFPRNRILILWALNFAGK